MKTTSVFVTTTIRHEMRNEVLLSQGDYKQSLKCILLMFSRSFKNVLITFQEILRMLHSNDILWAFQGNFKSVLTLCDLGFWIVVITWGGGLDQILMD